MADSRQYPEGLGWKMQHGIPDHVIALKTNALMKLPSVDLYIPRPSSWWRRAIWPGSAVVARGDQDPLRIYFEGRADIGDLLFTDPFEQMVILAWGRLSREYPTVACGDVARSELIQIGVVRSDGIRYFEGGRALLEEWAAEPEDTSYLAELGHRAYERHMTGAEGDRGRGRGGQDLPQR
jgi:hypothetical protein